jgi:tetratricopeptide (TPR) repeat protein
MAEGANGRRYRDVVAGSRGRRPKKILTLEPRQAEIYRNLCRVYLATQPSLDVAESLIQQALALAPSLRYRYLDAQALIWARRGKHEQALASLDRGDRLDPIAGA